MTVGVGLLWLAASVNAARSFRIPVRTTSARFWNFLSSGKGQRIDGGLVHVHRRLSEIHYGLRFTFVSIRIRPWPLNSVVVSSSGRDGLSPTSVPRAAKKRVSVPASTRIRIVRLHLPGSPGSVSARGFAIDKPPSAPGTLSAI